MNNANEMPVSQIEFLNTYDYMIALNVMAIVSIKARGVGTDTMADPMVR